MKLTTIIKASAALAMIAGASAAYAQADDWPNKPVMVIVPNNPGDLWDVVAREDAKHFQEKFGQPMVIDNRPGAGGSTAAALCTQADPDGYTFCAVNHNSLVFNRFTLDSLPYKIDDLEPVVQTLFIGHAIVAKNDAPFDTVEEWIAYCKENPVNFGTLGQGSGSWQEMVWRNEQWGCQMESIPYKGGADLRTAIIAGEIDMTILGLGNFVGAIRDGQMKLLAVDSPAGRSPAFPDAPDMSEFDASYPLAAWGGYAFPKGTPMEIVDKLNAFYLELKKNQDYIKFYEDRFIFPALQPREQFVAYIASQDKVANEFYGNK